jgi:pyridoxal biosynthesis lyase PdxS
LFGKADAALMMQLGCDGGRQTFSPVMPTNLIQSFVFSVFVGSGIFLVKFVVSIQDPHSLMACSLSQSGDPAKRARAIVQAVSPEPILVSVIDY